MESLSLPDKEALFASFVNEVGDMLSRHDPQGICLWISPNCKRFMGFEPHELIGHSIYEFFHPDDLKMIIEAHQQVLDRSPGFVPSDEQAIVCRIRKKDGSFGWFKHRVHTVRGQDGEAIEVFIASTSVTEHSWADSLLVDYSEFNEQIIMSAREGIIVYDKELRYAVWNKFMEELSGMKAEQVLWRYPQEVFPFLAAYGVMDLLKRALEGETVSSPDIRYEVSETNCYGWYSGRYGPLKDINGDVVGVIGLIRDITDRKNAEAALVKLNEKLEERIAERTLELSEANESLRTFANSVAHDLRAPLRSMIGFSTALLQDYGGVLTEEGRDFAERVVDAGKRMDTMLVDLLQFSKMSHAEMRLEPVDLEQVISSVLVQLEEEINLTNAKVHSELPIAKVIGHSSTLSQVFTNLITNSLKFVPENESPYVRITAEQTGSLLRINVEDKGIGIPPEHHLKIFDAFERLHSSSKYPGSGMGLAIVQIAIKRMGGSVGVKSQPGFGSLFWVELPLIR